MTATAVTANPFQYSGVANFGWQTWGGGPRMVDLEWPIKKNFTDIVSGKPFRRGSNARGVAKYSDFGFLDLSKATHLKNDARYDITYY